MRPSGDAVFDRQGQRGDAASGAKAFYPGQPPFPLLHVDTTWKFRDMIRVPRHDRRASSACELLVHINQEASRRGINPFTHGSRVHTDIMKTQALKQALDKYGFDAAFGGARRDEEKSRAKERVFSLRSAQHRWDPKQPAPGAVAPLQHAQARKGESIRVFPLSNWTELDVWQYIQPEDIPVVPLYFAAPRPVVERDGALIMVDDERMPLQPGEQPELRKVRFRTLGCYPLTGRDRERGATRSPAIIEEMLLARTSERAGRAHRQRRRRPRWRRRSGKDTSDGADRADRARHRRLSAAHEHKGLLRFLTCGRWTTANRR